MMSSLNAQIQEKARPYLDLVDKLRVLGIDRDFPIPQIAVMGDQSSGKSSCLEAISGVPFPRGTGLVTKCATQISMKKSPAGSIWKASISVIFDGSPQEQPAGTGEVSHPNEVSGRIESITQIILERENATFSKHCILILIESPDSPDLTIVDLPGIVRTTTEGQEVDVIAQVDSIIDKYLSQGHTINFCVIPANVDIATVDILERARKHNPAGIRTIGVMTKPDLVDIGAEDSICATLQNITKPLKLGYIMVKNRGQVDLLNKTSIDEAKTAKMSFFKNHPVYSKLPTNLLGVESLSRKCIEILVQRIIAELPAMQAEADMQMSATRQLIDSMGAPPPTEYQAVPILISTVNDFTAQVESSILGSYLKEPLKSNAELRLCVLSNANFTKLQETILSTQPNFSSPEFISDLSSNIQPSRGEELPGFLSPNVLNQLTSEYIIAWDREVKGCFQSIVEIAIKTCTDFAQFTCPHFGNFRRLLRDCTIEHITRLSETTCIKLDEATAEEMIAYTQNHYFMDTVNKKRAERFMGQIEIALNQKAHWVDGVAHLDNQTTHSLAEHLSRWFIGSIGNVSNEQQEAKLMADFLSSYWKLSSKRYLDKIPQLIRTHFLHEIIKKIKTELLQACMENVSTVFQVSVEEQSKRTSLEQKRERLSSAIIMMRQIV